MPTCSEELSRFLEHRQLAVTATYRRGLEAGGPKLGEGGGGGHRRVKSDLTPVCEYPLRRVAPSAQDSTDEGKNAASSAIADRHAERPDWRITVDS